MVTAEPFTVFEIFGSEPSPKHAKMKPGTRASSIACSQPERSASSRSGNVSRDTADATHQRVRRVADMLGINAVGLVDAVHHAIACNR